MFCYIDPGTGFTISTLGSWLIVSLVGLAGFLLVYFKKIFRFLKIHRIRAIIIIIIAAALTITGTILTKKEFDFKDKIIILAFDGLSPDKIKPMMKEGELPNFSKLKKQGSYKHLSTTNPSQSPVAWSGFSTGQNPGKNGIYDFIVRDPKTYKLDLSLSNIEGNKPRKVIKSKRFWQYASEKKVPAVIITCPITFPPDKIHGKMLSGMGVPDILGTEGTFTFYTTEPLNNDKDIGGKVFQVKKSPVMTMDLIGPRVSRVGGKANNTKIPFRAILHEDKNKVTIEYQDNKFELDIGQWSNWKEVVFKLSLFRKAKGILKFYLVETKPHLKLYISPINFDPRTPLFQISYPKSYSKELADNIGLYYTQGMPIDTWAVNENRLSEDIFLEQIEEVLRQKKAMLDYELNSFKKGILFCYFGSSDTIQHMFWRYIDGEHPLYEENAPKEYKEIIASWYKKIDNILGEVMEKINNEDTLIVLSDHGFNTFRRAVHVNSWLRENGYLRLKNRRDVSGRELLEDIDWSKTKAYSIGFGAIYVNQKGRERYGVVEPGKETELLKEELSQKLKAWHDEKYNKNIVNNVYKRQGIFWGEYADQTPDLYIGFNIGYRASWQNALGAVPDKLIEDNLKKWSGSHLFDPNLIAGIILSNKKIKKENPSIYDLTPTILESIGYSEKELKDCDFDGNPLFP